MRYEIGEVMKQERVMELIFGNCSRPKDLLGRHFIKEGQVISAYHPDAVKMEVITEDGGDYEMDNVERLPAYALFVPNQKKFPYRIKMTFRDGNTHIGRDPYCYDGMITKEEEQLFAQGKWTDSYRKLGCHKAEIRGTEGMYFAVWAPSARRVSVVGDFNFWNGMTHPMHRLENTGIFELFIPGVKSGQLYKFEIKTSHGEVWKRADPYALMSEEKLNGASTIFDMTEFEWEDEQWMKQRAKRNYTHAPLAMCEIATGEGEFTEAKIMHAVGELGCTHVLLKRIDMGKCKGRQRGFFEPVFYGNTPDETRNFINECHKNHVGVILEMSPGYFQKGKTELDQFDGTPLYAVADKRLSAGDDREICLLRNDTKEVSNYLLSNILFWIRAYHIDGFVFRGMSEALSLRKDKFKHLNTAEVEDFDAFLHNYSDILMRARRLIKREDPNVLFIGEDIAGAVGRDIFGRAGDFDFAWNYDIKRNVSVYQDASGKNKTSEYYRLSQPLMQGELSRLLLPVNQEKSRKTKKTLIDKKVLDDYHKLAGKRMSYGFLMGVPGKKIWALHSFEDIASWEYIKSLFRIYREYPALYEYDSVKAPLEWINATDAPSSVISFLRRPPSGKGGVLFVCNFDDREKIDYPLGVPLYGRYVLLSSSDSVEFGGEGRFESQQPFAVQECRDLRPYSIRISLPPMTTMIFAF